MTIIIVSVEFHLEFQSKVIYLLTDLSTFIKDNFQQMTAIPSLECENFQRVEVLEQIQELENYLATK